MLFVLLVIGGLIWYSHRSGCNTIVFISGGNCGKIECHHGISQGDDRHCMDGWVGHQ